MSKDEVIANMELQLKEQRSLIDEYRKQLRVKDEQLLDIESMLTDSIIDHMINKERSK
jgi:uncharacterized coiled-coil protein SlyX